MPNAIAFAMLAVWPFVVMYLFGRLPLGKAFICSIIAAYLLLPPLPAAFDLPLLPPFNKDSISHLSALLVIMFVTSQEVGTSPLRLSQKLALPFLALNPVAVVTFLKKALQVLALPDHRIGKVLVLVFILSPIATVLTNPEPLIFQLASIRGLVIQDMIALPVTQAIILIGYLLARKYIGSDENFRFTLLALMVAGLLYSLPMLVEIRLSPQLNLWIYGYFQHQFDQMMRGGGFRPIVFLNHSIWVAFFVMTSAIAALALWRAHQADKRLKLFLAVGYLSALLVLSKTLAPLLFLTLLVPIVLFVSPKNQIKIAVILATLAFTYPLLKGANLVPVDMLLSQAEKINPERAASLKFRFDNEKILAERVSEKPFFGWGSWGRNQTHNEVTGEITSVSDGRWIIVIGKYGWLGYIAEFGLLLLPLVMIWRESGHIPPDKTSPYLGPLSLILSVNMVDMLPNATLTPLTFVIAGGLLGYAEKQRRERLQEEAQLSNSPSSPRTLI